jgi:hypothetical protein
MRSLRRLLAVSGVLCAVAFLPAAPAQDKEKSKGEKVRFESPDGVDLHGMFYTSNKANPPTVLIVHAVGESSKQRGWTHLAEDLQQKGFAVLAFDMRGHGASDTISDLQRFWAAPANRLLKGFGKAITLDFKEFPSSYLPMLCNDIAAARTYLDRRNDMGSCNVSNLIVIGADSGAALASMWLHAEWSRYRCKQPGPGFLPGTILPLVPDSNIPEGNDIIGCVWLSMNPKLAANPKAAARSVDVKSLLMIPAKTKAVPMVFMYAENDKNGKDYAVMLEKNLLGFVKDKGKQIKDEKYRLSSAVPIPKIKLVGSDLLQKQLKTSEEIVGYLKDVVEAKGQEWVERQFLKTPHAWKLGNNVYPANNRAFVLAYGRPPMPEIGDKTLLIKDYGKDDSGSLR